MARTPQSAPRKRREKRRGGEIPELKSPAGKRSDTLQGGTVEGVWGQGSRPLWGMGSPNPSPNSTHRRQLREGRKVKPPPEGSVRCRA